MYVQIGHRSSPLLAFVGAVSLFAAVELLLLGSHVLHGGLYTDDWAYASIEHQSGAWGLFDRLTEANHARPLGALYLALTTAVSQTDRQLQGVWGLLTLLAATSMVYVLLRALSLRSWEAAAVMLLVIAFPFADSSWLWHSASHSYLAIALAALGGVMALQGLKREGRAALAYHVAALTLFAVSILTYQVAAFVICLSLAAYLGQTSGRRAVVTWIADVGVVALALALPRLITGSAGVDTVPLVSLAEQRHHAWVMLDQGSTLLAYALVPFGRPDRAVVLPVVLAVTAVGALVAWSPRDDVPARRTARRALLLILAGAAVVLAAFAAYVPAPVGSYEPLREGIENRVNVLASFGYATIVFGLSMIVALLISRLLRARAGLGFAVGFALAVAVFTGYAVHVRRDISAWNRAASVQGSELTELRALGRPASWTTVYTFDGVGETASNVPVFRVVWDLNSAVQLQWNDPTLHAFPIFAGTTMTCTKSGVTPNGPANADGPAEAVDYGHAVFYDLRSRRLARVTGPPSCASAIAEFVPGPVAG
ncbi:MAG TPA: hypothetical protein VLJ80_04315 [Solirubrobacteraceae bacterium]|nr:hypothetical protein [Solirubrobacteraceae bacterium]